MTTGRVFWLLLVLAAAVALKAGSPAPPALSQAAAAERGRPVRIVTAEQGTLTARRTATVTIEPAMESNVSSGASGRVAEIVHREGARVDHGDTVVILDDAEARRQVRNAELAFESARINLESAERQARENRAQLEAQLRAAERNLELAEQQFAEGEALFAAGGISRSDLLALDAQFAQAQVSYEQAKSGLERAYRADREDLALLRVQLRQAEETLDQAREALAETRVKAPFDGEVARVLVGVGEFVAAGSPTFQLVTTDSKVARFRVPPEDADALMELGLIWLRYRELDYAAQLIRRSPSPGEQRLVELTAELYPAETTIPAGTTISYTYQIPVAEGTLVPAAAVAAEVGQSLVYTVEDGVARRRQVTVLGEAGGSAALQGIEPNAQVIYPRPLDLRDGTPVEVLSD